MICRDVLDPDTDWSRFDWLNDAKDTYAWLTADRGALGNLVHGAHAAAELRKAIPVQWVWLLPALAPTTVETVRLIAEPPLRPAAGVVRLTFTDHPFGEELVGADVLVEELARKVEQAGEAWTPPPPVLVEDDDGAPLPDACQAETITGRYLGVIAPGMRFRWKDPMGLPEVFEVTEIEVDEENDVVLVVWDAVVSAPEGANPDEYWGRVDTDRLREDAEPLKVQP